MAVPIAGYAGGPFISCSTNAALTLGQRVEAAPPQPARVAAARSRRAAAEPAAHPREEEMGELGPLPTLLELIDDGLIDPGEQEVVASYKGSALTANLTRDGAIVYGSERFTDPAGFMAHLKKQGVMPRTADDGSKSVYISGVLLMDLRVQYWETRQWAPGGAAAGGSRRKPSGGRGGGRGAAAAGGGRGRKKKHEAEEEEPAYAEELAAAEVEPVQEAQHWVQCSRCETWRVVPDEHWPAVEADEREDWYCEDAWWDIATMEPFTGPCEKK